MTQVVVPLHVEAVQYTLDADVNARFARFEMSVREVAKGHHNLCICTGPKGIGKTETILVTMQDEGYVNTLDELDREEALDSEDEETVVQTEKRFIVIKGFTSAKGLYLILKEYWDHIVIFDDCDSAMSKDAVRILLAATDDTKRHRRVTWNVQTKDDTSFIFKGRIMIISNVDGVPKALWSRAIGEPLKMTRMDVLDRMWYIAELPAYHPECTTEEKQEVMNFIEGAVLHDPRKQFDLRVLNVALVAYKLNHEYWEVMTLMKMEQPLD